MNPSSAFQFAVTHLILFFNSRTPLNRTASGSTLLYAILHFIVSGLTDWRRRLYQGKHFVLIQPEDLLLVSHDGVILEESGPQRLLNTAAFQIHSAIHTARPDVLCAAHSHSIFGRAFSTLGRDLEMITQDSCKFYNDCAVYTNFKGVVLDEEEGRNIAAALGNKKAVILQVSRILRCLRMMATI